MSKSKTIEYYDNNSIDYIEKTKAADMSDIYNVFYKYIGNKGSILDLGCGSGRDSKEFISKGYEVLAVDGSEALAKEASKLINKSVIISSFEELNLDENYTSYFDGIWACASLLHVSKNDIALVIKNCIKYIKKNGVFYMSFKIGEGEAYDELGRYFNYYTRETFMNMIKAIPDLHVEEIFETGDSLGVRNGIRWLNVILKA